MDLVKRLTISRVWSSLSARMRGLCNFLKYKGLQVFLSEILIPKITTKTPYGNITLFCPSRMTVNRAKISMSKEPGTNLWIDSFKNKSVFWDIGANIGVYSLYAAMKGNLSVLAFEPLYSNYMVLMKNLELNRLTDKVNAFCFSFSDNTSLDYFYVKNISPGYSGSAFGDNLDYRGNRFNAIYRHMMISFSVDDFLERFEIPIPNYIKIDVDGIEAKILKGAINTINDKRVKSILVELDHSRSDFEETIKLLENAGFAIKHKESTLRSDATKPFNYIFLKK